MIVTWSKGFWGPRIGLVEKVHCTNLLALALVTRQVEIHIL